MRRLLSILFLLFSSIVSAQKPAEPAVVIQALNSKFQFVNKQTGVPVNGQLWDEADQFVNGYARVLLNNKFSFVNSRGNLICPVDLESARNFSNKLAAVKKEGKWGFINESGKSILPFNYDIVFDFEGSITVAFSNKKWWLINNKGDVIKSLDITACYGFKNGIAKITRNESEGIMDTNGKITFTPTQAKINNNKPIPYQPNSTNAVVPCPDNIDFENGSFLNWQCYTGTVDSVGTTNVITVNPSPPTNNRHTMFQRAIPSAIDPYGLFPTNPPDGSNFAVRLGNTSIGAQAERIQYTIHVPLNDSNFSIKYDYAVVFEDPGHTIWTQPRFISRLLDSATNTYIDCASFEYISTSNLPGFAISPVDPSVIYKPWSSVFYNLRGYGGQTLYLEFTTADCVRRGHWGYAYVDVESTCDDGIQIQYDCTFPNITTLTGPPGFQFYNWWDSSYSTLLGSGQTITLNPGPTINTIIWLELIPFNNFGCTDTVLVKITGDFDAQFDMSATSGCAPQTFTFYNRNLPSLTTLWDFGDGTTGTGDTVTHTYNLPGTYLVQLTVTMAGGCTGYATHQVVIYPAPNVAQPPSQTLCNGATTNATIFTGTLNSTIFNWTNNNTSIGLGASGTGNINAFTAINTTNAPVTATITVTPFLAGCPGTAQTFTITVNPTANVVQPPNQTLCNGATTNAILFTGSVSGSTFSWTNNNNSIGLGASGTGNINAFTAINTTNAPVTATITVTPSAAGCAGTPQTFTITVNPTPDVAQPANQTLCNGAATNAVTFTGSVSGSTFNWTNNNTSIGLGASGNGNIPAFTAINTTNVPVTATITVTPSAAGCAGTVQIFTITVNPTPDVAQPADQTLCNGSITNAIIFTGAVNGTVYTWTNTAASIGLPASGTGNIAPFTAYSNGLYTSVATITVTPTASGCPGPVKTFTVTVNPEPNVVQPPDQSLCNGATTNLITLTGSMGAGAAYTWTNNNPSIGLAATGTGDIAAFTAINTTNATVTATITVTASTAFCSSQPKTFRIAIHPTPSVVAGNDMKVCLGSTAQLSANGAAQYFWSPATGLSCTNCPNPVATPIDTIQYIVRGVSSFGCMANDTISLNVIKPFQMLVSPNDTLCIGESAILRASGADNYLWSPPAGLNRTDIAEPRATPNATTQYRVVGYDRHNCFTDTSFVRIVVGPKPKLDLGPNQTLSTGTIFQFNPVIQNGPIVNWTWAPATGLSCTNCPTPTATVKDNTYYTLSVTNNYGCITNDTIFIFVFCKSAQVFIPNAFTPDGDGLNDVLMVRGKGIFVKSFRIFNRWGELVFEKTNFNPNDLKYGWDGRVRGVPATPDVFVYTAEVICDNSVMYTYKGNTTLLK